MSWLKIDHHGIDTEALQKEIEEEVKRIRTDPALSPPRNNSLESGPAFQTPGEATALIEMAEAYADGWDTATLARRRPFLRPFLPLIGKLLKRVLKPQYVFNSLVLELLRIQEERIHALEKRASRDVQGEVRKGREKTGA